MILQQAQIVAGIPISARGRPASVDVNPQKAVIVSEQQQLIGPNPGVQAVTRKITNQGMIDNMTILF